MCAFILKTDATCKKDSHVAISPLEKNLWLGGNLEIEPSKAVITHWPKSFTIMG